MEKKYTTEEIYNILKSRIIKLEYEPGLVLNEQDLAEEFNISRTPIRTVFQKLNYDDLIIITPRIGARVSPINYEKLKSIFELTRELDSLAAAMAVDKISESGIKKMEKIIEKLKEYKIENDYQKAINLDQDFHDIVHDSCGNAELKKILEKLHYHTERLWHYSEKNFDSMDLFIDTLSEVLDAFKAKDRDWAFNASKKHIDQFVEKIKRELL